MGEGRGAGLPWSFLFGTGRVGLGRARILWALAGLWVGVGVQASVPPVVPGFPHDQTFAPGQLLYRQVGLGRVANIIYHNGRFYSNNVGGGSRREWIFSDPADPSSFTLVNSSNLPGMTDQGTHSHSKSGDYAGGAGGFFFRRVSPGINANNDRIPEFFHTVQRNPEGGALHRLYYPWATPFNWIQYGPGPARGRIWRATQLLAEWDPLGDHGVGGTSILLGNLLFIISDASMLGVLAYDISPVFHSPPEPPRLLDKFTGPVGGYIGAVWEHYLVLAGGEDRDLVFVLDYSDPTDLRLVRTFNLRGTDALNAGTNVPYVQTQDQYVFTRRHKINMESFEIELEFDEVGHNRPPGSVAGPLDISQYTLPVGNLLVTGSYSFAGRDGVGVWAHQASPDTRGPYVGYHIPRPGQTHYPLGAPISLVIAETLESFTIVNGQTILLRPVGGQAVDCWTSFSHDGVLTLTPRDYLLPDTTYEVVLVEGGIKDAVGNGIEGYSFTFSTGGAVSGGNQSPLIHAFEAYPAPLSPGEGASFSILASDPDADTLEYRFTFGDGSPPTEWSSSPELYREFPLAGHYEVKAQVRDLKPDGTRSIVTATLTLTVAPAVPGPLPTHSGPIALDEESRRIWVVNPDNDSVSRVHADSGELELEVRLGPALGFAGPIHPRNLTVVPGRGDVWVACSAADRIVVLDSSGAVRDSIATGYGSSPQAVVATRDGTRVFASLYAGGASNRLHGQLWRFDAASAQRTGILELGPTARALAVTGDGQRVFVARFISREHYGEIWDVNGASMTLTRVLDLWRDRGLRGLDSGGADGPGVPNYISSLVLSPQQDWLWYTAIKMDTNRGLFFQQETSHNLPLTHDSTVRSILGRFPLTQSGAPTEPGRNTYGTARGRVDVDNSDSPSALAFSPRGDYVFVALQGNDAVAVFDDFAIREGAGQSSIWRLSTGSAPQGLLFDTASETLWVKNFLGRDLTTYRLEGFLASGRRLGGPTTVATVIEEALAAPVLAGKRLFYFAGNRTDGINPMSFEGYISCASCHFDGGHDGRTWDFTQRGEGFRNTTDLRGRSGMAHGRVHWSANFDEIQDFVHDIVNEFGGTGFLPEGQNPHPPLGLPNAGRSPELDQLAAFVESLGTASLPRSPSRADDGNMSPSALAGAAVFHDAGCATCHLPARGYTDSTLSTATLHDVGTLRTSSGSRLGQALTGIDTPTLLGLWDSGPYFHDGSAETLDAVFRVAGGEMYEAEQALLSGGAATPGFPSINEGSTFHGNMVWLGGGRATFTAVDGGSGGIGAIELRILSSSAGSVRVTVNDSPPRTLSYPAQRTHFEWRRLRFEDVPLHPGRTNSVVVERASGSANLGLDNITVSTADTLLKAHPHRVALGLSPIESANLREYLLQLDGRDSAGLLAGVRPQARILSHALPLGRVGAPWLASLQAEGGLPPYSWSLAEGHSLPPGLSLDPSGLISGLPHLDGAFTFEVVLANGSHRHRKPISVQIVSNPAPAPSAPQSYQNWAAAWFAGAESRPEAQPQFSAAGDGAPNLLKFALGLDPWVAAYQQVPRPRPAEGHLSLHWPGDLHALGLVLVVEVSDDLHTWRTGSEFLEAHTDHAGRTTWRDRTPFSIQAPRFMRFRVEPAPP